MVFDYRKYEFKRDNVLKDPRSQMQQFKEKIRRPQTAATVFSMSAAAVYFHPIFSYMADIILFYNSLYFTWLIFFSRSHDLPFKMPKSSKRIDPNNKAPGTGKARHADGILYIGNEEKSNEEIWFTNSDARTHILYLGTTGSGKTEGLKSMVTNSLGWGSGFIYVDGKADTDLWGSLSALARRYGRDDDLLVLNYMTGNSDGRIASNTVNPFSQGSASYLTNLLVSLMPETQGDNAMWKDRAVALIASLMPVLTWRRTNQEKVLNINTIRDSIRLERIIELSRMTEIPERMRKGLKSYLYELPGYTDTAFNDDGTEKPTPNGPPADYSTIRQQHGYLAMQFTRQLQSLSDDYGYIFETPAADIDMQDVVLNRRLLVVLIPALEKSADETANLGKIVGSMLKGMMGATLGATVEGDTDVALENKPTRASTPFMAIFDEVGYYTTQGMAVMAAQARSLGFCLIYAGQDLPALEKRIKEEARSITANCNLKIFGKLEDPTQTKEFFEKTVGETTVIEASTRKQTAAMFGKKRFADTENFNVTSRANASYNYLKSFKEGQSIIAFGDRVVQAKMFYSNVGKIRSLRVNKFIAIPHPDPDNKRGGKEVDAILERMRDRKWTAEKAAGKVAKNPVITKLSEFYGDARKHGMNVNESGAYALTQLAYDEGILNHADTTGKALAAPGEAPISVIQDTKTPQLEKSSEKTEIVPTKLEMEPAAALVQQAVPVKSPMQMPGAAPKSPMPVTPPKPSIQQPAPTPKAKEEDEGGSGDKALNWDALVAEDTPVEQPAVPEQKSALSPERQEAREKAIESKTSTSGSLNWSELVDDEEEKEQPAATQKPFISSGSIPAGGFGVGGFGTGFGGIGGLAFTPGALGTVPANPASSTNEAKSKNTDAKIKEALDEDKPMVWKDIVD